MAVLLAEQVKFAQGSQVTKRSERQARTDNSTTKALIDEGWNNISRSFINERVDSMPNKLQAVIDGQGAMTGY